MTQSNRRDFLRDFGLSAAALPFVLNLPSLLIRKAEARQIENERQHGGAEAEVAQEVSAVGLTHGATRFKILLGRRTGMVTKEL